MSLECRYERTRGYLACKSNGEVVAGAGQPAKLYKALQAMYNIRLPDAVELHEIQRQAKEGLKVKVEREARSK
jgi:hypothetical protein